MTEAPPTMASSSPLPDSLPPAHSNAIPIATLATSHVDQLSPSPPHPAEAFSPTSASPPSFIPPLLPSDPSTPPQTLPSSPQAPIAVLPRKVHPADLITATNQDPHRSPAGTPSEELDSPYDAPYSPVGTSDANHSVNGGVGSSHRRSEDMRVPVSENGGHVGHGSEEDGTSLEGTVVEQMTRTDLISQKEVEGRALRPSSSGRSDVTARSVIQEIPSYQPKNGTAVPRSSEASTSHSRQASSSTRAPEPFTKGAISDSREGPSSRGAGGERQSERGDKERAKEKEVLQTKDKERDSTRSRRVLGEWTMGKTLGAGSMGKVKLGVSGITGEKVCIIDMLKKYITHADSCCRLLSRLSQDSPLQPQLIAHQPRILRPLPMVPLSRPLPRLEGTHKEKRSEKSHLPASWPRLLPKMRVKRFER